MDIGTLEEVVRSHQAGIYRYLRFLGADDHTAEDLVQNTFLAAFKSSGHPDMTNIKLRAAWLRGIARNIFLSFCRSNRAGPLEIDSAFLEQAEHTWKSEFLRDGEGFDYIEALRKCLETLPDKQREAVGLQYAQKKSRSEIAHILKMTEDGIKSLLRRARAALADCVNRRLSVENM